MGDDGWLLEDGPKWCSILVSTTEVRTTLLFYIYGSWVSKRILILRDRIPNYDWSISKLSVGNGSAFLIGRTQVSWYGGGCCWEGRLNRKQGCCVSNSVWPETRGIESLGPGFSENLLLAVNKANVASYQAVSYPQNHSFRCEGNLIERKGTRIKMPKVVAIFCRLLQWRAENAGIMEVFLNSF